MSQIGSTGAEGDLVQRLPVFPHVETNIVLTWHFALESTLPVPTLGCRQPFYPQVPNISSSGHIFALGSRMIISPRLPSRRWPIIRQLCIPQPPRRRWLPRRRRGNVGPVELERLIRKLELDKEILADQNGHTQDQNKKS